MKITIPRNIYLNQLIDGCENGFIKIVTGMRRCGKSTLLQVLFKDYLLKQGTPSDHIISIALDDRINLKLRNPDKLLAYLRQQIIDNQLYYILMDEIQMVDEFMDVLNSLLHLDNVDVYVTGSNSHFLSNDIVTEFRDRSDEIHMYPFSFSEYYEAVGGDRHEAWKDYYTYGGLPHLLTLVGDKKKSDYLNSVYRKTYLTDIKERHDIKEHEFEELIKMLSSSIGSPCNPNRLTNTFKSKINVDLSYPTVVKYIDYLKDSFLIEEAERYDIKGRKYIGSLSKYYFCDIGVRNTILNFRQQEENHIMENILYNELRMRGYNVDVGMVETKTKIDGNTIRKQYEVDFVVNEGSNRYYIQSAFAMPNIEKEQQEKTSFSLITDSFKKIIVVKEDIKLKRDDQGIVTVGLLDFLLNKDSLKL
ncbi:MAG: ATP-binding protein [Prevotella sp.]|jgi:predicted AAA+ superfamily ATPase